MAPSDRAAGARADVASGISGAAVLIRGELEDDVDEAASPSSLEEGSADFGGSKLDGGFRVLHADPGEFGVASDLGTHAVWRDGVLDLAAPADLGWGTLRSFWALEAIERLIEVRRRLPAVGCLRLDDFPGTAQHQAEGRAKSDDRQRRRLRSLRRSARKGGAVLNLAIAAEAFDEDTTVPLESVWPRCVQGIAQAVAAGEFEPVCHGLLHLDPQLWHEGSIEFREFARLERAEALERIEAALSWQRRVLGEPRTFVAPAWGYSKGTMEALAGLGIPAWLPPAVEPLAAGPNIRETLTSNLEGLHRLDLSPLRRLSHLGVPPTVTFHGGLFDSRSPRPSSPADAIDLARLLRLRDIDRVPRLDGVRWVGAGELAALIAAH